MSDYDLETLETEYNAAVAETEHKKRIYDNAVQWRNEAAAALVDAVIDAGLTEYGPITSELSPDGPYGELRRVWKFREMEP